uniref:Uncharacterized protein n=1 Tax=Glossina palpalis gambiensis TaxID=67801 RepID=A0A1B0B799_9MUSC
MINNFKPISQNLFISLVHFFISYDSSITYVFIDTYKDLFPIKNPRKCRIFLNQNIYGLAIDLISFIA